MNCFIVWGVFFLLSACSQKNNWEKSLIIYSPHGKELLTYFENRFEEKIGFGKNLQKIKPKNLYYGEYEEMSFYQ